MKIRPVGAELFHVDRWKGGQRDMAKLTVAFRNFSRAPKNESININNKNPTFNFPNSKQDDQQPKRIFPL